MAACLAEKLIMETSLIFPLKIGPPIIYNFHTHDHDDSPKIKTIFDIISR